MHNFIFLLHIIKNSHIASGLVTTVCNGAWCFVGPPRGQRLDGFRVLPAWPSPVAFRFEKRRRTRRGVLVIFIFSERFREISYWDREMWIS